MFPLLGNGSGGGREGEKDRRRWQYEFIVIFC